MIDTLRKLIYSGFSSDTDTRRRLSLIYVFWPIPVLIIMVMFFLSLREDNMLFSSLLLLFALYIIFILPLLRITKKIFLAENMFVAGGVAVLFTRIVLGGEPKIAVMLALPWAVFAFFLAGRKMALFWVGVFTVGSLIISLLGQQGIIQAGYTVSELAPVYPLLAVTVIFLLLSQRRQELFQKLALAEKKEIEKSQARLRLLLESISDGVIAIDRNWKIQLWNKAVTHLTERAEKEVIGKPLRDVLTISTETTNAEDIAFIEDSMVRKAVNRPRDVFILNIKNGRKLPVRISAAPISNSTEQAEGVILTIQDVSEAKKLDTMKSELISTMAHQIRTPLSIIEWHLELLQHENPLNKAQHKYTKEIERATKRTSELTNELLLVTQAELGTFLVSPLPLDFQSVFKETLEDFRPLLNKKKLTLHEAHESLPLITADENLLRLIYRVLLANAIKYTPEGGTISVSHVIDKENHEVILSVSDSGFGIDPQDKEKIFTKLFRSKKASTVDPNGFGLELFTIKTITETAGGRIWFVSPASPKNTKKNPGTAFYVAFPLGGMRSESVALEE